MRGYLFTSAKGRTARGKRVNHSTLFGAVFAELDLATSSSLQFFDINGNSLTGVMCPARVRSWRDVS